MIPISLENKKALVGGSSEGLGKAIAMQLAQCGATVVLVARNEQKLKNVIQELPAEFGQQHQYLVTDYADLNAYKQLMTAFLTENPIDILVNNTNGPSAGTVFDKNLTDYQTAFELLFQTVVHTTMTALPNMQKNNFGRIINVSSLTVAEPKQNLVLSNSIRSALVSWSKTLSNEVAKHNITVNNILTGLFDTKRLNELNALQAEKNNKTMAEWKEIIVKDIPMKRLGKPEEYGHLAAFLASDLASYITGTSIPIDGGLSKSI